MCSAVLESMLFFTPKIQSEDYSSGPRFATPTFCNSTGPLAKNFHVCRGCQLPCLPCLPCLPTSMSAVSANLHVCRVCQLPCLPCLPTSMSANFRVSCRLSSLTRCRLSSFFLPLAVILFSFALYVQDRSVFLVAKFKAKLNVERII